MKQRFVIQIMILGLSLISLVLLGSCDFATGQSLELEGNSSGIVKIVELRSTPRFFIVIPDQPLQNDVGCSQSRSAVLSKYASSLNSTQNMPYDLIKEAFFYRNAVSFAFSACTAAGIPIIESVYVYQLP